MKKRGLLLSLLGIFLAFASYSQVYERVVLEDNFGNDASGQTDVVQGNDARKLLYVKGVAAGSGIRESFLKLSLADMDNLTSEELNYAKVELRLYSVRTNADAGQNQIGVYPVTNDWNETTLTWTNSRALSAAGIEAGAIATGTGKRIATYSGSSQQGEPSDAYNAANESRFDISAYAIAQYKAGNKTISVMLHVTNNLSNGDQQMASKDIDIDAPGYEQKLPKVVVTTPVPTANFTAPAIGFMNTPVVFTNTSSLPTSYAWDFGDGATSTEANPSHAYTATGTYTVTLTINGDEELVKSQDIRIYPPINIEEILGGNMEAADQALWNENGRETILGNVNANDQLVWGDLANPDRPQGFKPAGFETGGFLTVAEGWSTDTQYYIWQAIQLTAGAIYKVDFDYAVGSYNQAWFQVLFGTKEPGAKDYSDNQIGSLIPWSDNWSGDGGNTLKHFSTNFTPAKSGLYFFVIKWGCNGNGYFNTAIDNVKLTKILDPVANFTALNATHVNNPITFTNTSSNAVSYAWDFGDGETSTDESPVHSFENTGTYTVTLTVTGNGGGTDQKSMNIKIYNLNIETIAAGNMEVADKDTWNIVGATTFNEGGAVWGETIAGFGTDGVLNVKDNNATGTQYYIWQAVELVAGSRYDLSFDYAVGAYRRAWCEIYIGTTAQPGGNDYTEGGSRGTKPISWADGQQNGNFEAKEYKFSFIPTTSGIYFYVIKCGTNNSGNFDIAIDNVTLNKIVDPVANFTADVNSTWINLPVEFTNTSLNADSYDWNFGDGETSADENPTHSYTELGTYTVSLTVTGGGKTDTKTVNIKVLGVNIEAIAGGTMEAADRDLWAEFGVNNLTGGNNDQLVWGDIEGERSQSYKPKGFGTDGFLTACEDWAMSSMYKIAQAVSLRKDAKYNISFDYEVGSHRRAYFEVFVGTSIPNATVYNDNRLGESLIPYVAGWDGYIGEARKFDSEFMPENDGIYYFVIQLRGGDTEETYFNVSMDNVLLVAPTGIGSANQQSIRFALLTNEIQISEVAKSVKLISMQGQNLLNVHNTNSVNISSLAKGVYLLQIQDNQGLQSIHKIVIR